MSPRFSFSEVFLRTQSDARLCVLAADGQPLAFAMLVERHHAALIRTAARVGGIQRAEDAVQEALLRAWTALRSGTQVQHVPSWLHQIVHNSTLNQIARERAPTEPLPDQLAHPQQLGAALDERQLARDVLAQIAALPGQQRTALVETELGGRSRREIAADLGLTEGAVRQLVYRARSAVRVAMTAITPYPLAAWVARRGASPGAVDRLAGILPPTSSGRSGLLETLAAGSAAGSGVLIKGSAVLIAAGALGGGVAWRELTAAPAHHRIVASARRAEAARHSPFAIVAAVEPVGVAGASPTALTASSGTTRTPRPPTSQPGDTKHSSPAGDTGRGDGSDGSDGLAAGTPTSTADSSPGNGDTASETAPVSSGSSDASDTSGPSETNTVAGSGDSVSGSGTTTSGSGSDSGSGTSSGSAGSSSVDSSGSSTADTTETTSTTASGGD